MLSQREVRRGGKALYRLRDSEALSHASGTLGCQGGGWQAQAEGGEEEETGEEGLPLRGLLRHDPVYQGLTELAKEGRSQPAVTPQG